MTLTLARWGQATKTTLIFVLGVTRRPIIITHPFSPCPRLLPLPPTPLLPSLSPLPPQPNPLLLNL